ncbi:sugar phosphate isomerase/epimerase [Arenibacter sp. GZD96]|uniref:sugar phosphate isomerase/epimerase family protein n=1 Tax=Aurantibrevibacter litoralis TaxID=3106030 RepID=UPI002B002AD2|nr:sugar phosphate isomerase/epimerase [Arenibacter sp. GZD-96]MEA1785368.1 sugar phosphate isomerase/epimerase [Arenibacter sp. GZD-96]
MNSIPYPGRRKFIQQSGVVIATAVLPITGFSNSSLASYKMGIQLFTIRDAMAKDPVSTLGTVRALGYEDGEIYGFDGEKGAYYGIKAKEFKKMITDLDFTVSSGHYDFSSYFDKSSDTLQRYVDQCIEGSLSIGAKYITWPWLAPEYRTLDNFKLLSEKLNRIGERVTQAGLGFAYHNHDFEFTDHDGQIGYDIILAETDPKWVKLQMDMYWVVKSSAKSPAKWIAENPGRFVMWHIKDMDKVTGDYSEMGNGSIDYVSMLATLDHDALEYYYIEQGGNFKYNSMQSITDSAVFVKAHLKKYL